MSHLNLTGMSKPVPHVHQEKIIEWAADPTWPWQVQYANEDWRDVPSIPRWHENAEYRRKPRWYDMAQEWIALGQPPVEIISMGMWRDCNTILWADNCEYRLKDVLRHAAVRAEWEAKGRPLMQWCPRGASRWEDVFNTPVWNEETDYRIKPTPHPDADVWRAFAEDKSIIVEVLLGSGWVPLDIMDRRYRICPDVVTVDKAQS